MTPLCISQSFVLKHWKAAEEMLPCLAKTYNRISLKNKDENKLICLIMKIGYVFSTAFTKDTLNNC